MPKRGAPQVYPERQPPAPRVSNSSTWRDSLLVFLLAILIRILTTSTLLFVPQTLPAFDKSADDLLPSSDRWIQGFLRWDALYFTQIAQNGYTREQEFAFMPGLPYLMRLLGMMSEETTTPSVKAMVLTTSVLANIAAVVAAILFHRLSLRLLRDPRLALTAACLFCFSPAPATFSSPYNEPFFSAFSYAAMLALEHEAWLGSALLFAAATAFRANGVLHSGFFIFQFVIRRWKRLNLPDTIEATVYSSIVCAPFAFFQRHAYKSFCLPWPRRPWCHSSLPFIYTFVQDHYWDNGLFRYWTLLQLPLFIISAPVLYLSFRASWIYYSRRPKRIVAQTMPFVPATFIQEPPPPSVEQGGFVENDSLLPYIHLHTVLICLLFFASHVQIILRLAPTLPVLYWHAAQCFHQRRERWWISYCCIWAPLSVVLWAGFYPPA